MRSGLVLVVCKMFRNARRSDFRAITALSRGLYEKYGDPLFPVTDQSSFAMLERFLKLPYFKVHEEDGELKGWMAATSGGDQHHSAIRCLSQIYYHTTLNGLKAARTLVAFHDDLLAYADKYKYEAVITTSYLPTRDAFTALLVRAGWTAHGGRLSQATRHHPALRCSAGMGDRGVAPRSRTGKER